MSVRLTYLATASLVAFLFCAAPVVEAQAWLADRSRAEGVGIRVGNLELHPGVGAEIGYDSNVFKSDGTVDYPGDRAPQSSAMLRVTPHLFLSTLGSQRAGDAPSAAPPVVDFRFGGSLPIYYYFSTPQRGRAEANADFALTLLPQRPVSVALNAGYARTARPFAQGASAANYGRNTLDLGPRLNFQTAGGVLKFGVGGDFSYTFFDEGSDGFGQYDTKSYGGVVNASWEFLPKTALVYESRLSLRDFDVDGRAAAGEGPLRNDGTRFATRIGVNGALSARVSASLLLGYTSLFFEGGDDIDDFTLSAELRWKPSDTVQTSIGYDRSLNPAYQGNYSRSDRISAKVGLLAAGALLLSLGGNVSFVWFGQDPVGNDRRKDTRVGADLSAEYRATDWFAFTGSAGLLSNMTSFQYRFASSGTGPTLVDPAKFTQFEAFVGMRLFY